MKRKLALLLSACLLAGLLAGCGQPAEEKTDPAKETETTTPAEETTQTPADDSQAKVQAITDAFMEKANAVQVGENDVTFVDDSGREALTIAKNPQKVAVLYGSHACLWTEAGGTVSLAIGGKNAVKLYEDQIGRNILEDEGVVTVADSSSAKNWDVEAILAEKPDLIICSTQMSGYSTISAPAEAANIPVIALTYSGLQDYLRWFKVFSNLNGKPELWDEVAQGVLDRVVEIVSKVPDEGNPTVLSILPKADGLTANTSASDTGAMLKEMKAVNVADPNNDASAVRVDISLEEIFAANPDYILVQCQVSEEDSKEKLETLINGNPVWDSLDAVKEGRVYYLPKALFQYRPNHQYRESYEMLAELIYPGMEF